MPCLKLMRPVFKLKSSSLSFLADKKFGYGHIVEVVSIANRKRERKIGRKKRMKKKKEWIKIENSKDIVRVQLLTWLHSNKDLSRIDQYSIRTFYQ